jgi:hypothetical protein
MSVDNCESRLQIRNTLYSWVIRQSQPQAEWLQEKLTQLEQNASERLLFTTFSTIPRRLGKQDLALTPEDLEMAEMLRPGWSPRNWSLDQAGRTLILLSLPHSDTAHYQKVLAQLFATADVSETVALYQSFPLLPHADCLQARAAEGIRSNMSVVFNAIALHNPYPAEQFDTPAWNQMVLKALFVGSPLHQIWGLDQRSNPELARMLSDYAHERWAAKRPVTPELWRPIGPFLNDKTLADLERVFSEPDAVQQTAAALACAQSTLPQAQALLAQHSHLHTQIRSGQMTWTHFSQTFLAKSP